MNLLHQVGVEGGSAVVHHKNQRNSVKRMYSARINGCQSIMAVALYQGEGAEDVRLQFLE
jgi:hypothetical protein